jgi:hypothetical protein
VSTQALAQSVVPGAHVAAQTPSEQTWGGAQTWPQAPQFLGSLRISVQAPPLHPTPLFRQLQTPFWHEVPAPHAALHAPQLALSVASLTQPLPQADMPAGQPQTPPEQVSPEGHRFPQPPQLRVSVIALVHAPLQKVCPAAVHAQAPATQVAAAPHAIPHAPQFAPSVCSFTQAPPQSARPAAHCVWHVDSEQTTLPPGVVGHAWPHAPQSFGFDARLTHCPPHIVGVANGHRHRPPTHALPPVQALPQPLQLALSLNGLTHARLQSTNPAAHANWHVPPEHTFIAEQAALQLPQLPGSEWRLTQTPLQIVSPAAHVAPSETAASVGGTPVSTV